MFPWPCVVASEAYLHTRVPPRSELEALALPGVEHDWDQGQLKQKADTPPEVVKKTSALTLF